MLASAEILLWSLISLPEYCLKSTVTPVNKIIQFIKDKAAKTLPTITNTFPDSPNISNKLPTLSAKNPQLSKSHSPLFEDKSLNIFSIGV